ncbi:MAG: ferritin-like domain-containing protein [gamma proteobacterium endosymbiont of Lamellibrachia anaximandri]|nr:ferritin-like domain-containing protein [gamma proteobacterium endosymbiont of Lamellibrachia anaximandri]
MKNETSLYRAARRCLLEKAVETKLNLTDQVAQAWRLGELVLSDWSPADAIVEAGHPPRPELVHPSKLPRRGLGTEQGRVALIHAITHIEFNAINLAWDAVQRFPDMPEKFYSDWIQVAVEEVRHFRLLRERLRDAGADYGDFPAHNGLWEMAVRTADDPLVRMALVPRMLEARGLDVTPGIMARFRKAGDQETVAVLQVILDEEVGHVQFGSDWFAWLCEQRGVDPETTYFDLLNNVLNGEIRCPLHRQARLDAGFSESELERLEALCAKH